MDTSYSGYNYQSAKEEAIKEIQTLINDHCCTPLDKECEHNHL